MEVLGFGLRPPGYKSLCLAEAPRLREEDASLKVSFFFPN